MKKLILGVLFISLFYSCTMKDRADLIIVNANVYTVDSLFSKYTAFAVKDGKILALGADDEILNTYRASEIIDAQQNPIYPGFNDAHCHFFSLGESLTTVDLRGALSYDEVLERLVKANKENPSKFLVGEGWDQNLWQDKTLPSNKKLTKLFQDIPVVLKRIDFHAVIANEAAIKLLGLTPNDTSISPGEALMDGPNFLGVFLERTADRFKILKPELSIEQAKDIINKAQEECFKNGLTSISDADQTLDIINILKQLQKSGDLKIRVDVWLSANQENISSFKAPEKGDRLSVSTLKLYIDGALGSRGALMLEPYSDMTDSRGIYIGTPLEFENYCQWAYNAGFQVATHCIGDAANREALRVYSKLLSKGNDKRWRIEHAQVINPQDLSLFKEYSIIPSIQPTHATSDMIWAAERLGDRIKNAYIYQDLLKQNGWLPSGTDFPIEQVNPMYTFYSAVFRKNREFYPEGGFQIENALTREQALKSMTIWAAKANFEERVKGSLEPGKYADFVIMDKDIMTVDEHEIFNAKVLKTFVGGELVYFRDRL